MTRQKDDRCKSPTAKTVLCNVEIRSPQERTRQGFLSTAGWTASFNYEYTEVKMKKLLKCTDGNWILKGMFKRLINSVYRLVPQYATPAADRLAFTCLALQENPKSAHGYISTVGHWTPSQLPENQAWHHSPTCFGLHQQKPKWKAEGKHSTHSISTWWTRETNALRQPLLPTTNT